MQQKRKLLVICGPTATGKTSLGIRLAKKFNGEIVSADSRQVYIGMDIATGKDVRGGKWRYLDTEWAKRITEGTERKLKAQRLGYWEIDGIPVWMLDVVRPNQDFSVADYVDLVWKVISDIWNRKKLPIMVGGTGFYIKGVVDGIETLGVPPDWELRKKLSNLEIKKLRETLQRTCPERLRGMNESDRNNPRRLIRAIEIAQSKDLYHCTSPIVQKEKVLFIGLTASYKVLYQRIDERVEERIKEGAEEEIRNLLAKGYTWDNSVLGTTIGYKEWKSYFENQNINKRVRSCEPINIYSVKDVIQRWKFDEHGYARRQMTWFKKALRQAQGHWFDITTPKLEENIEKMVSRWYKSKYSLYHFVV